jgi:NAD(P)H-nitrite reductase large subunit
MDLPGVVNCWTLEDARKIAAVCKPGNEVVLVGAGFIGCIILEALARSGVSLTVVEAENRMVPRMMNEVSGGLIKTWCENKGVAVRTSARVKAIEQTGGFVSTLLGKSKKLRVVLESGEAINADMVISATGVRPNTGFLEGSGIDVDDGILVDACFRTSKDKVFAAGDVCQGYDFSTGARMVQAIQPTATEHGRYAAANMTGISLPHQGSVNMNVLDTMGLISSSFGLWMGTDGGDSAELADLDRYRYINLQFDGDVIVGASSLGLTNHVGVLRGMIQSKTRLNGWKDKLKQDPTLIMEAYMECHQTLSPNPR